jgi:hypothetical protein
VAARSAPLSSFEPATASPNDHPLTESETVHMSTASQVEVFEPPLPELSGTPRREAGADPLVLGLPLIAVGAFALGLQLVGFVNVNSSGSPLAVLIGASGFGPLLSTLWSASLPVAPVSSPWAGGTSLPTTVLGAIAG